MDTSGWLGPRDTVPACRWADDSVSTRRDTPDPSVFWSGYSISLWDGGQTGDRGHGDNGHDRTHGPRFANWGRQRGHRRWYGLHPESPPCADRERVAGQDDRGWEP